MKKQIIITADTNDGDYVTEVNNISEKTLELLRPIIKVIKANPDGHNWETGDCGDVFENSYYKKRLTPKQIELMNEYVPKGEYGIHTIDSIEIQEIASNKTLL